MDANLTNLKDKQEIVIKLNPLVKSAYSFYNDSNFLMASKTFEKAWEYAEMITELNNDEIDNINNLRKYYAHSFLFLGDLFKSIEVLLYLFKKNTKVSKPDPVIWAMINYIELSQQIPLNYQTITTLYLQTEQMLSNFNNSKKQSCLLHLKSRLLNFQGMYPKALEMAQEAITINNNSQYRFSFCTQFKNLTNIALASWENQLALKYLKDWESKIDNKWSESRYYLRYSEYCRSQKQIETSIDFARKGIELNEQIVELLGRFELRVALIRSYLSIGELKEAKKHLSQLPLTLKSKDCGHARFETLLIIGDFFLASARQKAGIDPVDDEYGTEFKMPTHSINPIATFKALEDAMQYCRFYI